MTLALAGGPMHIETRTNSRAGERPPFRETVTSPSLSIALRYESGQYVAVEDQTGMFGEGDTPREALDDLIRSLYDHRRDLAQHERQLSAHLRGQLEVLNRLPR